MKKFLKFIPSAVIAGSLFFYLACKTTESNLKDLTLNDEQRETRIYFWQNDSGLITICKAMRQWNGEFQDISYYKRNSSNCAASLERTLSEFKEDIKNSVAIATFPKNLDQNGFRDLPELIEAKRRDIERLERIVFQWEADDPESGSFEDKTIAAWKAQIDELKSQIQRLRDSQGSPQKYVQEQIRLFDTQVLTVKDFAASVAAKVVDPTQNKTISRDMDKFAYYTILSAYSKQIFVFDDVFVSWSRWG